MRTILLVLLSFVCVNTFSASPSQAPEQADTSDGAGVPQMQVVSKQKTGAGPVSPNQFVEPIIHPMSDPKAAGASSPAGNQ